MKRVVVVVVGLLLVLVPGAQAAPPATGAEHGVEWVPQPITANFTGIAQVGPMFHCIAGACPGAPVDGGRRGCRLWRQGATGAWTFAYVAWNTDREHFFVTPYAPGWHWANSLGGQWGALPTRCLWGWQLVEYQPQG
jgi:hypothetical protein